MFIRSQMEGGTDVGDLQGLSGLLLLLLVPTRIGLSLLLPPQELQMAQARPFLKPTLLSR